MQDKTTADFGYEEIPASEKQDRVGAVFTSVAEKYDLITMSCPSAYTIYGNDLRWKCAAYDLGTVYLISPVVRAIWHSNRPLWSVNPAK